MKQYHHTRLLKRLSLLVLLLACSGWLHAQQEPPVPDTVIAQDSALMVEEYTATDEEEEEPEKEYFLRNDSADIRTFAESIRVRKLSDSSLKVLKEDDAFWYADYVFGPKKEKKPRSFLFNHPLFEPILWIIIVISFAAIVVIYLGNSNIGIFRRSRNVQEGEEADVETEDIFAINYQKEIDKAVAAGNYRLATRLLFLRLLRNLSDKKIIQYKQDRTNFDYLMQLQSSAWYNDFFRLTRNYEYSWYGHFEVDSEKFSLIKKDFDNFDRKLN